jgi:hypothetical protein
MTTCTTFGLPGSSAGDHPEPRLEFRTDHYPRIRVYDPDVGHDRFLYLHRCTAFAHGVIDSIFEPVDVHHSEPDKWDSRPVNLERRERHRHAEIEPHVRNLKENHNGKRTTQRETSR